jgi:D-sedoheptulose 7-phosphate isomerase
MNMEIGRYVQQYVEETRKTLEAPYLLEGMRKMVPMLLEAREKGRTIYFFGNGGSASTASHFVCDIGKGTNQAGGKRLKCHALNDSVTNTTAWANDADYSKVFSEPLATLGEPGDVVVAISGSGNSPNVLKAVEVAKARGMRTIGLTGIGGGKLKDMVDLAIVVPSNSMQHTEDVHLIINHLLTAFLRDETKAPPS